MKSSALRAPELLRLRVTGVKLYNDGGALEVGLQAPTLAFVGANGIGKSTLLALVNFALTGIVVDSKATSFRSVEEFVQGTSSFASSYFSGRVEESARNTASVDLQFRLGSKTFAVQRGLFDGHLVRSLRIVDSRTDESHDASDDTMSESELAAEYQNAVVLESGLATFDQFCFWQLFIMTFDERRHLLFWDKKTLHSVLMIALGRSPHDAVAAEGLRRNIERQDSLARNAKWRATQATNSRRKLTRGNTRSLLTDEEREDLEERFGDLIADEASKRTRVEEAELTLRDTSRRVAELAIAESELEKAYLSAFSQSPRQRDPGDHPILRAVSDGGHCDVCGSRDVTLGAGARKALESSICPICDSHLMRERHDQPDHEELVGLDKRLNIARRAVEMERTKYQRVREESAKLSDEWRSASQELERFQKANSPKLDADRDRGPDEEIRRYDLQISEALRDAEEHRRVRDEFRASLEPIILGLVEAYGQIEMVFVPNFRSLAEKFIGRSVDIEFERSGVEIGLRFALEGQSRRNASELSESQQFFLDIALRMSIIQTFLDGRATFLVDTPEGSLDIAYETRAGMLFDLFVQSGHSLMMMSNLNSSNLLYQLTSRASSETMKIFKMVEWARLSDVQLESAELFDEVYAQLDASLNSGSESK